MRCMCTGPALPQPFSRRRGNMGRRLLVEQALCLLVLFYESAVSIPGNSRSPRTRYYTYEYVDTRRLHGRLSRQLLMPKQCTKAFYSSYQGTILSKLQTERFLNETFTFPCRPSAGKLRLTCLGKTNQHLTFITSDCEYDWYQVSSLIGATRDPLSSWLRATFQPTADRA